MTNQFDPLELAIIQELDAFLVESESHNFFGDRTWTSRIKERIGDLGIEKGFDVAASGFKDKFESEWLFDITWYIEDEDKRLTHLKLAVESEWSKSYAAIKYDFEKLLAAKAEKKMLICQCKPADMKVLISLLQDAVAAFQASKGDRYFIAILDSFTEDKFEYHLIES